MDGKGGKPRHRYFRGTKVCLRKLSSLISLNSLDMGCDGNCV
ncbi:hypothetical protein MtrunA17_Chr3g0099511 [Medicago truncatula]|uniref:Uncharacterized protein n=1 Tax=Medicago truncatula TaxID=3880 RepID=A0A396IPA7_MEDTR|nr:hypothetical protein MtrunA17_Chr3g0099511 [Medicago truncatula]